MKQCCRSLASATLRKAIGERFDQTDTSIMLVTGNENFIIIGVTSNLYSEWTYGRQEKPAIYTPAPKGYAGSNGNQICGL